MDRPRVWRGGRDPFEEMGEEGQYPGASGHRKCWGGGRGTFSPVPTRSRQPNITNITADFFLDSSGFCSTPELQIDIIILRKTFHECVFTSTHTLRALIPIHSTVYYSGVSPACTQTNNQKMSTQLGRGLSMALYITYQLARPLFYFPYHQLGPPFSLLPVCLPYIPGLASPILPPICFT